MRKRWISWACWHWNLHNKIVCTVSDSWAISKSSIPSSWKRTMHIVRSDWIRAVDRTPGAWRSDTQEPDDQQNKEIINHVVLELTTYAQKSWVWALITPELVYRRIVLNPLVIFIQKNNLLLQAIGSCCCVWGLNRNCCGLVGWLVESGNLCVFREDCAKLIPSYSLLF